MSRDDPAPGLAPFSLANAPAFIERQFPVGRLSAEAFAERKAVQSQTLTALGSYWKGRKPLILCRAVTLGCLLPATDNPVADLATFLALMAMDDAAFARRWNGSAAAFARTFPDETEALTEARGARRAWRTDILRETQERLLAETLAKLPYAERVRIVRRPEECNDAALLRPIWPSVNAHLGTSAFTLPQLVEQLGVARFGHRPCVADTFCGGGSIPFEAARIGCDVHASDLNPVACMLTWGAFNIIGASPERRAEIAAAQADVAARLDTEITAMGIEHDATGNRAKAYLYCLETRCPKTGWMVPMAPSWVISKTRNVVAMLIPDHARERYDIAIETGVDAAAMADAELGTVRGGRLIHPMNPDKSGVEIKVIRGDKPGGGNALRPWTIDDFVPRTDDILQERVYCIQWLRKSELDRLAVDIKEPKTFFAAATSDDIAREAAVEGYVSAHLSEWQATGLIPNMPIEPGDKTDEPIRTRGWTHWHHLFSARQILMLSYAMGIARQSSSRAEITLFLMKVLDWNNRLCYYGTGASRESISHLFYNQAFNAFLNYGVRSSKELISVLNDSIGSPSSVFSHLSQLNHAAIELGSRADCFITDPPYADAVKYEEITEFFIAWLRKYPPPPFDRWTWDSRRAEAITGQGADFRRAMADAYSAMTRQMTDTGLQVVMFTHQDAGMWADLAGIMWASGLRVTSAWNIVTEVEKPSGTGNYVQGTVCLVLRKRGTGGNANQMNIEGEIEDAVKAQLAALGALDIGWTAATGGETLYTDGDLTLAAYAAALTVVTRYATIDRRDVGADVFRELKKGEKTQLRALIDYAASVANRELVPRDFPRGSWRDLDPASRFYVRMLDMEDRGSPKVADFQNFAKSFALADYTRLMSSTQANAASLAGAAHRKGLWARDEDLRTRPLFQLMFALWRTLDKGDPKLGLTHLQSELPDFWTRQRTLSELARYVALKTRRARPEESRWADELAQTIDAARL